MVFLLQGDYDVYFQYVCVVMLLYGWIDGFLLGQYFYGIILYKNGVIVNMSLVLDYSYGEMIFDGECCNMIDYYYDDEIINIIN